MYIKHETTGSVTNVPPNATAFDKILLPLRTSVNVDNTEVHKDDLSRGPIPISGGHRDSPVTVNDVLCKERVLEAFSDSLTPTTLGVSDFAGSNGKGATVALDNPAPVGKEFMAASHFGDRYETSTESDKDAAHYDAPVRSDL